MKPLSGKKILMVIAHKDFRDEEYREPRKVLEDAGAQITVASSSMNACKGMLGMQVKPDLLYTDARAGDYDAVVFVGGNGAQEYWEDPKAHAIAREADKAGKIVSAICIAPVILANAGLLKGKEATVWPSESGQIEGKGARYRKAGVVRDGRFVTADGPASAAAFGKKLVEALGS